MAGGSRDESSKDDTKGPRPSLARTLFRLTPWSLRRDSDGHTEAIAGVVRRLDSAEHQNSLAEQRIGAVEHRLDHLEDVIRTLQDDLERVGGERLLAIESRLDGTETTLREVNRAVERTRDEVIPAVVDRGNLLIDRLASELDEVASLVERSLLSEPLPAPTPGPKEKGLSDALKEIQPRLVEAFRGSEEEIRHRLDRYLPVLLEAGSVLDLGCGRGELLLMLRDAGIEAVGLERDPALLQAARRRGLELIDGDVATSLAEQPDEAWGAVTAIHLLEHLESVHVLEVLAEVRRILRPGGLLLVECPNPHTLRVGAAEYWIDPTHLRPLLPETLQLFLTASGLRVDRVDYLHPYPADQKLSSVANEGAVPDESTGLNRRVDTLIGRLDDLLNGPRDFVITASKPNDPQ